MSEPQPDEVVAVREPGSGQSIHMEPGDRVRLVIEGKRVSKRGSSASRSVSPTPVASSSPTTPPLRSPASSGSHAAPTRTPQMVSARLAAAHLRSMTGRDIFVLSGGGSRGAAQIGMLRALLGAGIAPDALVGGSVGALNACFLGGDPTPGRVEALADHWMQMTSKSLTGPRRAVVTNLARRRPYLYSADRLRTLVSDMMAANRLEDLAVPVRVATTELATGRPAHHDYGNLLDLLAASAALPGLFPPVMLGQPGSQTAHVDAGIAENIPLTGAAALAVPGDRVWILDITKRARMRNLRTPLDVLVAALAGSITNRPAAVFTPGVEVTHLKLDETYDCGTVFDFSNTGTLFRLGEESATTALLERRALR
jgi:NTE family protein